MQSVFGRIGERYHELLSCSDTFTSSLLRKHQLTVPEHHSQLPDALRQVVEEKDRKRNDTEEEGLAVGQFALWRLRWFQ